MTSTLQVKAQYAKQDSTYKKCFVGSSLFMLGNLAPVNRPDFIQLNLGYRITGKADAGFAQSMVIKTKSH